jgi:mono/diheme cytochrome c family protein
MTTTEHTESGASEAAPLHGLIAEYDTPTALVRASKKVRDAGYSRWDTFTPFPIHGIEKAMGIRMTRLPWIVLCSAMVGLTTAVVLQWWTNAIDYPWIVSGKPFWSWPANVPVWFELTVLFSAFATLGGMFALNNLPLPSHPLDLKERFRRVSDDKFFLVIEARDPKFDDAETKALLESTQPVVLDTVYEDRTTSDSLPKPLVYTLIVLAVASFVPFAFFAQARSAKMDHGRLHAIWDMDFQPKYKAQRENPLFADRRSDRLPEDGTVANGMLFADEHLYDGKAKGGAWATKFPKQIALTDATMERGKQKFGTYCAPCHGFAGEGDGMVSRRASTLGQGWVPPSNLHQEYLRLQPVGELYNTITHGIRNMPAYGPQILPEDRWAVVMYVRALQRSKASEVKDVPESDRSGLK